MYGEIWVFSAEIRFSVGAELHRLPSSTWSVFMPLCGPNEGVHVMKV